MRVKRSLNRAVLFALSAMGVASGLANHSNAAVVTYNFDVNGSTAGFGVTTGSTYDWDDTTNGGFWSNNGTSTTGNIATNGWVQGNFPKFQPAGTPTYIVTVSNNEQITGLFASTAQTLTINAIGSGGLESIDTGSPNGFLGSASNNVIINAPIKGAGAVNPSNGGNVSFNGVNTYTGATLLNSSGCLVHFNNGSAFGTGVMSISLASTTAFVPFLGSGGATITLPNNVAVTVNNTGINFGADANTPVTSTGNWSLGANLLRLRNNGDLNSPLKLSGVISGSAGMVLSSNTSGGVIIFSGANTYTGPTTITGAGATGAGTGAVRFKLGAANTIATSSSVVLAGGILDPGGFNHTMSSTTLGLIASTGASTIDYIVGASEVDFANSSGLTWAGSILNLANWNASIDKLRFGTDSTGLTSAQLAKIEFNGSGLGTAGLDPNGYVITVPEPSMIVLMLSAPMFMARRRKV